MDGKFKVGDIVRLKSGGPKMTIVSVKDREDDKIQDVHAEWFTKQFAKSVTNDKKERDYFVSPSLELCK